LDYADLESKKVIIETKIITGIITESKGREGLIKNGY